MPRTSGPTLRLKLLSAAGAALVISACGSTSVDGPGLTVVATTTVLGDVVSNVVGGDADVVVLTPVGVDPHDFQPSAAQVAELNRADLVVANGLGLEEGLEDVLVAAERDGVRVLFIADGLDPLPFSTESHHDVDEGDHEDGEDHGDEREGEDHVDEHDHGSLDPHVWLDPVRMANAARAIASDLAAVAPDEPWIERAADYADLLLETDGAIGRLLQDIPADRRVVVTNHDSLGYFADRYDFRVLATVIPAGSTLADPSSAEVAELVELMRSEQVTAIFAETTQPTRLADAVAAELGSDVQVVSLFTGSLSEPGGEAETLVDLLITNASLIAGALGG